MKNTTDQKIIEKELIDIKEKYKDLEIELKENEGKLKLTSIEFNDKKDENVRLTNELEELKGTKLMLDKKYELNSKALKEYKSENRVKQKELLEGVALYKD